MDRLVGIRLRHPPPHGTATQPLVLEEPEPVEIRVAVDVLQRIEVERFRPLEPEGAAGCRIEVPPDDLPHVRIEAVAGGCDSCRIDAGGGHD